MGIKSDLEANFDFEIVDEFLDHYSMMIDSMEMMTRLAALVEDELQSIRDRLEADENEEVNEETINWLLEISDMFGAWYQNIKLDEDLNKVKFSLLKIPDTEK